MTMNSSSRCVLRCLLVLVLLSPVLSGPCPPPCSCPQPAELHCTFHALFSIPAALPKHLERINLGFNSISQVADGSLRGFRKLQQLMLHGNNLHSLPDGAFRDLASLQMLKMSYNKLQEISRRTLHGLWSLIRLHLDHNHLESIQPDTFQGLTALRLLQLEGNRLQQLHPSTFSTFSVLAHFHISTVRHLHLSDNELASLPPRLLETMPQLENLYLHGNPWRCDCGMRWLQDWQRTSPGVLKCKNGKALPGDKLCAMCLSPRHLNGTELHTVENLVCHSPVISSPHRSTQQKTAEKEKLKTNDFKEPLGNVSLNLSDEHGNKVDLECSVGELKGPIKISWEEVNHHQQLVTNISFSVDLECPVDRAKYEQLWRLIAYYSSVPARLQEINRSKTPYPTYTYKQDSAQEALYYTGVKAKMMTQSAWLMQPSVDLQLNQPQSSAKIIQLILGTNLSKTVESELERRQRRAWVMIESTSRTHKVLSVVLGGSVDMYCNVHSSDQPTVQWVLPDGSKLNTAHHSVDNRISTSKDGRLVIKTINHKDTGIYYCISWVFGDFAVLPFYLSVQESSKPPLREETSITFIEEYLGNPLSLDCTASGSPDAEINWILPSNNIVNFHAKSSKNLVYSNGTLHIPKIQLSDNGYYKCVAINPYGVDTLVKKISVVRRKGLIQPLWAFQTGPQSASRVNALINVPTVNTDEDASGDIEMTEDGAPMSRLDLIKRNVTGGVAQSRRVTHLSRKMWERPPLLRKSMGSNPEDGKMIVGNRRIINISKAKIDPKKWADILGKIRGRNTQNSVTMTPVQYPAQTEAMKHTKSLKTPKESSNSIIENERLNQATTDSYTAYSPDDITLLNNVQTTIKPQPSQSAQQKLDQLTSSKGVFVLPKTTSASLQGFTANNTPNSSVLSLQESFSTNTDVGKVKTADMSKAVDRGVNTNLAVNSRNDREHFFSESQIISSDNLQSATDLNETSIISQFHPQPSDTTINDLKSQTILITSQRTSAAPNSVRKVGSERQPAPTVRQPKSHRKSRGRKRKGNRRKHKPTTPTAPVNTPLPVVKTPTAPVNTHLPVVKTPTVFVNTLTVVKTPTAPVNTSLPVVKTPTAPVNTHLPVVKTPTAPVNTHLPVVKTPTAPVNTSLPVVRTPTAPVNTSLPVVKTPTASVNTHLPVVKTPTAPVNTPLPMVKTSVSTELQTEPLKVKVSSIVPFSKTQVALFGTLSQTESTVLGSDCDPSIEASSLPGSLFETKGTHTSTSATPVFTTASLGINHGSTTSLTILDIWESASPGTLITQPKVTKSPSPLENPSADIQRSSVLAEMEPLLHSDRLIWAFQTVTHLPTDMKNNPSANQHRLSQKGGKVIRKATGMGSPILSPPLTTVAFVIEPGTNTISEYMSIKLNKTPSKISEEDLETKKVTALTHGVSNNLYQTEILKNLSKLDQSLKETQNRWNIETSLSSTTSSTSHPVTPSKVQLHNSKPNVSFTEANITPSLRVTTHHPGINASQSQEQENLIIATMESNGSFSFHPTIQSPSQKVSVTNPTAADIESQDIQTSIRTAETLLEATEDASIEQQLTRQGSMPRGKSKMTKNSFQTVTVKAGRDAQLPCEAEGQPRPLLSWTKVATDAVIAQNTRTQMLEVHLNGTLSIRSSQPVDAGQYLCTVQNENGTDEMVVNLVVLSEPPQILGPRHRDVTVHLGGKVQMDCIVEGHPVPQVTWILPNHVRMTAPSVGGPSHQHISVDNSGTLRISQTGLTNRGIYKCVGSNAVGSDTVSVLLSVVAPKIQQTQHENMTLPEGGAAYLNCAATGSPQPVVSWLTPDGIQLSASQSFSGQNLIVFPNGTLHIRRLDLRNSGSYKCSVKSPIAPATRTVTLYIRRDQVSAKATISSSSPQRTNVIYGSMLLLNCVATGEPKPWILWRTPSKKLVDAQYSFDPKIKVLLNGSITVHPVTGKDGGDYLCVARNNVGEDYVQLWVGVLTRPAQIDRKQQRSSQEVVHGEDLRMDCAASGLPSPEIHWVLPDGTTVNPARPGQGTGSWSRYVVFDNGTLYFDGVGMPEEGDYTCYAENQLGKDEMKVRVKVKTAVSPPQIQDKDRATIKVFHGQTVELQCNAKGEPPPVITWMSPTNRLISPALDRYQILNDGTLVIQNTQSFDDGNYTCMAKNGGGQDHKVARLEVLVSPSVINNQNVAVNVIEATAVQGQKKLVDCVAKEFPTPQVMWILPGHRILPAPYHSSKMTVHQNGTLEIHSAKKTDSGQLVCVARNDGGEVRLVVNLDVKEAVEKPQTRVPETEHLSLRVGNTMALNCSFEGSKLPPLTWILPNGTPLHAGARYLKFFHQEDGSLIISNPTVAEAGMYRCLGHNYAGLVERTIIVIPGRKPEIQNSYISPVSIMNGETLFLHCQTIGEAFRLMWTLPSGVVLNRLQRAGRYAIMSNGTLTIHQASIYDRGLYVCRASNEYGSSLLSVSVTVIVQPPKITTNPPSVTYAKRGVAIQLNCIATGVPKVEVVWETPDKTHLAVSSQPHLFGNKYVHPQGSLIIQSPTQRDAGIYRCTAKNAFGMDSKTTLLNVF